MCECVLCRVYLVFGVVYLAFSAMYFVLGVVYLVFRIMYLVFVVLYLVYGVSTVHIGCVFGIRVCVVFGCVYSVYFGGLFGIFGWCIWHLGVGICFSIWVCLLMTWCWTWRMTKWPTSWTI